MRSAGGRHDLSWRAVGAFAVVLLAAVGSGMIVSALTIGPIRPPQPPAAAAPVLSRPTADVDSAETPTGAGGEEPDGTGAEPAVAVEPAPVGMPRSEPVKITIRRIGVDAKIMQLGIAANGMVEVPPLKRAELAGWYKLGPAPGEIGNAVIIGHVDSAEIGPAVFFKIGALRQGDVIEVTRKDKSVARFHVDGVASYPKSTFPNKLIYGASDDAGLRLVTCGGKFDEATRNYPNNVVVFATLAPPPGT